MHIVTMKSYLMANFISERQGNGELRLGFHPSVITAALDAFQGVISGDQMLLNSTEILPLLFNANHGFVRVFL